MNQPNLFADSDKTNLYPCHPRSLAPILALIGSVVFPNAALAQALQSVQRIGATSTYSDGGVAVDAAGNVYVAGTVREPFDQQPFAGGSDFALVKFDKAGAKQWSRLAGGPHWDFSSGVRLDRAGNAYVFGKAEGGLDGQTALGGNDAILIKYNRAGEKLWTRIAGSLGHDGFKSVAIDSKGNIYAAGYAEGNVDGQLGGEEDILLAKYDRNGKKAWAKLLRSSGITEATGIAVDLSGSIYLTGRAHSSMDGQPYAGDSDFVLIKVDSDGKRIWTRMRGGAGREFGKFVQTDAVGNVYAGYYTHVEPADPLRNGTYDITLVKYTGDGSLKWAKNVGWSELFQYDRIALGPDGSFYVTTQHRQATKKADQSYERQDYLSKYNSEGEHDWTTPCWPSGEISLGSGITVDSEGFIYVSGNAFGPHGLGKGRGPDEKIDDIVVLKFAPWGPSFACALAETQQEKLICQSKRLSELDATIARLYAALLKSSPKRAEVKAQQVAWIRTKRNACTTENALEACMTERADFLQTVLDQSP